MSVGQILAVLAALPTLPCANRVHRGSTHLPLPPHAPAHRGPLPLLQASVLFMAACSLEHCPVMLVARARVRVRGCVRSVAFGCGPACFMRCSLGTALMGLSVAS